MWKPLVILLLVLAGCTRPPQLAITSEKVGWEWNAPSGGSKVYNYVVQIEVDGEWMDQFISGPDTMWVGKFDSGHIYRVRVAGMDEDGFQGPFSVESDVLNLQSIITIRN